MTSKTNIPRKAVTMAAFIQKHHSKESQDRIAEKTAAQLAQDNIIQDVKKSIVEYFAKVSMSDHLSPDGDYELSLTIEGPIAPCKYLIDFYSDGLASLAHKNDRLEFHDLLPEEKIDNDLPLKVLNAINKHILQSMTKEQLIEYVVDLQAFIDGLVQKTNKITQALCVTDID